ncbi:hypothetical protein LDENG_00268950 [Lucifuga dentata]|nr:hypothetical protein LDENG_00268950 [Lucifuga dentata]
MGLFRSRNNNSVTVRCIKACQNHDISCSSDPVHLITHTALSLPTFREFREPEEIVFLRTVVPANQLPGADVFFSILTADDHFSFDVGKRSQHGMIMGVVQQVKPITNPKDLIVEVTMNYVASGFISHRNVVIVHIFISEFWF